MKYLTVIALYVVFSIAAILSGLWGLVFNTANVFKAQDRLMAAMLGWNGRETVSRECKTSDCKFCKVICKILNKILEPNHCEKQ